jgi:signal peptide peptidase SppA
MTPNFPHLAQRLFNVPLAITPGKIEVIMAALADRLGVAKLLRPTGEVVMMSDFDLESEPAADYRGYDVVQGVAIIPVQGTLVQKLGTLRPYSGMTGYDGIRANLSMALDDDQVRAIVLDCDSPGGEVSGCFDLVDAIYEARGEKPIWSILTENAYSACYALGSAADKVIVPRTGGTGSVGVICAHVDFSRMLDEAGITVELITYGDRKADGNPYNPLGDVARARLQADVDAMGDLFVETVARNRKISKASVRKTQAATFMGAAGVDVGFADAVMAPSEAFRSLLAELG